MKKSFRRLGAVLLLAFSSFTLTSIGQPQTAHAIISAAAWPLFPLIIVGVTLEGAAVLTGATAIASNCQGYHHRARRLTGIGLAECVLGIVFLDENNQSGTVLKLTLEQAHQYGLTEAEMRSYNHAVDEGEMEEIFQQAAQNLRLESTHDEAREVMQSLLLALPDDVHRAFTKIATHLVNSN